MQLLGLWSMSCDLIASVPRPQLLGVCVRVRVCVCVMTCMHAMRAVAGFVRMGCD